eukprot:6862423-Pyramimonas_sp.AAC.1
MLSVSIISLVHPSGLPNPTPIVHYPTRRPHGQPLAPREVLRDNLQTYPRRIQKTAYGSW